MGSYSYGKDKIFLEWVAQWFLPLGIFFAPQNLLLYNIIIRDSSLTLRMTNWIEPKKEGAKRHPLSS